MVSYSCYDNKDIDEESEYDIRFVVNDEKTYIQTSL